jgi:Integrase core domain
MITLLLRLLRLLPILFGGHRQLALENLALRQQLAVYKRTATWPGLRPTDRPFWVGLVGDLELAESPRTDRHSPWQNPFAGRLIGSIRRDCLNHVVILGEQHLRRTLARYFAYYQGARTHLSLDKDAPRGRPIEQPELGSVIPIREVGGLHHRYIRRAA